MIEPTNFDLMTRLRDCANGTETDTRKLAVDAFDYINVLRRQIEYRDAQLRGVIAGNELNLEDLEHLDGKLSYWRYVAELLYIELRYGWCSHCGAAKTRSITADEAVERYLEARANV